MPGIRIDVNTTGAIRSLADFEKSLKDTGVAAKLSEKELEGLKNRFAEKLKADEASRELNKARESLLQLGKAANLSEKEMAAMAARMGISLDKVNKDVRGATANVTHLENGFSGLAKRAAVTAAALVSLQGAVSFAGKSFNAWKEYESGLIDMGKVTDESITSIRKKIESIPAALGSSTELVRGYYQTISAGVTDADAAMDVLVTSAKAAKAAHVSQDETIKVLTKTMAGFEGQIRSAVEATDLLFSIEKLGQTSFSELVPVMGDLATATRMVGVSHQELAAGMALLTQTSGSTAEAGTKWRAVMMGLFKPTENMAKTLKSLGYETGQAMVAQLGLMGALQTLERAAKSGGTQLGKLFESSEGLTGIAAMGAGEWERYAATLREVEKSVGGTDRAVQNLKGTAEDASKTWDATMANLAAKFGEELAPTMTAEMERFSKTVIDNKDSVTQTLGGIAFTVGLISKALIGATRLYERFTNVIAGGAAVVAGKLDFSDWALSSPEELKAALQKAGEQHRRELRDAAIDAGQQFGTIDLEAEFGLNFGAQAEKPKPVAPPVPVSYSSAESEELLKGTGTAVHQLNKAWSENLDIVSKLQSKIDSGKLSQEDLTRAINDQREAWGRIANAQDGYTKKLSGGGGAAKSAQEAENFLASLNDQIAMAEAALSGDTLQSKLSQVDKKWNDFSRRVESGLAGAKLSAEEAAEAMARIDKGRALETQAVEAQALADSLKRVADIMGDIADASGSPSLKIQAGLMNLDAWERESRQAIEMATQDEAQRAELLAALEQGVAIKRLEVTRDAYESMSSVSQKYWDAEKALIESNLAQVKETADDELAYKIYAAQEWDDFQRRKLENQANSPRSQGEAIQAVFALDSGSYKSAMGQLQDQWKSTAENMLDLSNDLSSGIAQGLGDALRGLASGDIKSFEEVWQSMLNRMLDSFISFLEDMLTEWLKKNVFGAMLGGNASGGGLLNGLLGGGAGSGAGSGGGIFDPLLKSLPDKIGDSVGNAIAPWSSLKFDTSGATSLLGDVASSGAEFGSAAITEMMGSMDVSGTPWAGVKSGSGAGGFSFGGALGGALTGAGMGGLSSSLFGGDSMLGTIGGAAGGLIGSMFGPVGSIVGGLIGGLAGLFGDGGGQEKTEVTGQGYATMFINNQSNTMGYQTTRTTKGDKVIGHDMKYVPLSIDEEADIDAIFDSYNENFFGAFKLFGFEKAKKGLESFTSPMFHWTEDMKEDVIKNVNTQKMWDSLNTEGIVWEFNKIMLDVESFAGKLADEVLVTMAKSFSVARESFRKAGINMDEIASEYGDITTDAEALANDLGRSLPGKTPFKDPVHLQNVRQSVTQFAQLAQGGAGGMVGVVLVGMQTQSLIPYTGAGGSGVEQQRDKDINTFVQSLNQPETLPTLEEAIGKVVDQVEVATTDAVEEMVLSGTIYKRIHGEWVSFGSAAVSEIEATIESAMTEPLEEAEKQMTAWAHTMDFADRAKTIGDIVEERLTGTISGAYSAVQEAYESVMEYAYQEMDPQYAKNMAMLVRGRYSQRLVDAFGGDEKGEEALKAAVNRYKINTKSELEQFATDINYYQETVREILKEKRMEDITDSELEGFIGDFWKQYNDMMTAGYVDPEDLALWDSMAQAVEKLDEAASAIEELGGSLDTLRGIAKAAQSSLDSLTDPYFDARMELKTWSKNAQKDYKENLDWVDRITSAYGSRKGGIMGMDLHASYSNYISGYEDDEDVTGEVQAAWLKGVSSTLNEYFGSAKAMARDNDSHEMIDTIQTGFRDTFGAMTDLVMSSSDYSAAAISAILRDNLPQDMATALEKAMGLEEYNNGEAIKLTDDMIQGLEDGIADAIIKIDNVTIDPTSIKEELARTYAEMMDAKFDQVSASWVSKYDEMTRGEFGVWADNFIAEMKYFHDAATDLTISFDKAVQLQVMQKKILDEKINETLEGFEVDPGNEMQTWAEEFLAASGSIVAALKEMGKTEEELAVITTRVSKIIDDKLNDTLDNLASTYGYSRGTEMESYMRGVMTDFHDAYEAAVMLGASEEKLAEIRQLESDVIANKLEMLMESIGDELAEFEGILNMHKINRTKGEVPGALYDAALLGANSDQLNQIGLVYAHRVKALYQAQIEEVAAQLGTVADALDNLADTLKDYLEGLWTDFNMTPLEGPATYNEAKKQWEDTVFNLGSDDIKTREEAQGSIIEKTNAYLDSSKRYNAVFEEYYEDFMRVQNILGKTYEDAKSEYELMQEQLDSVLGIEKDIESIAELQERLASLQAQQNATWEEMIAALPDQIETAMKNALMWKENMQKELEGIKAAGGKADQVEQYLADVQARNDAINQYMVDKTASLNAQGYGGRTDWTRQEVLAAMRDQGMTPEQHYFAYGQKEGLSWSDPNILNTGWGAQAYSWGGAKNSTIPYDQYTGRYDESGLHVSTGGSYADWLDPVDYYQAKATQLNATGYQGRTNWTLTEVAEALKAAGMTALQHYDKYGQAEGVGAGGTYSGSSSTFNEAAYYANKAAQLNATGYGGSTSWTASQVQAGFAQAGLTAAQHYAQYGVLEGVKPYASGGYINAGQLALVGEEGPELVQFEAPARIYNHTQTANMAGAEYADLKAEIAALRREMAAGNKAIAENTQKTAKTLEKFDVDGLPAERTEA